MAAALDVRQKQRAVIEFLCFENETVENIHKRLKNVYGDDAVDGSTVSLWAHQYSGFSLHRHTARTPDNVQHVNDMVLEDRRVTVKEMSAHKET
jgi:hypothetical protein